MRDVTNRRSMEVSLSLWRDTNAPNPEVYYHTCRSTHSLVSFVMRVVASTNPALCVAQLGPQRDIILAPSSIGKGVETNIWTYFVKEDDIIRWCWQVGSCTSILNDDTLRLTGVDILQNPDPSSWYKYPP